MFHSKSYIPRKTIYEMLNESCTSIISMYHQILIDNFSGRDRKKLENIRKMFENTYNSINNESKIVKKLSANGVNVDFSETVIDSTLNVEINRGRPDIIEKQDKVSTVSIKNLFKTVLERPGLFHKMKQYLEKLKQPHIKMTNFMQGD